MYSFNDQMQKMFGGKVYRLCLSAGCTCPNRDGTLSRDGCIFCSAGGSGDFAQTGEDILLQIEHAKRLVRKKIGTKTGFAGYMAYFQAFTNTYGDTKRLAALYEYTAALPEVVALSVATRPDCLSDEMLEVLAGINVKTPVFVELGLQTIHADTALYINRCYETAVFEEAFYRLKQKGLRVVAHVMIGLPGEDANRSRQTVAWLSALRAPQAGKQTVLISEHLDGIKLQLLYVLKGTKLAALLPDQPLRIPYEGQNGVPACPKEYIRLKDGTRLPQYTLEEYALFLRELLKLLPPDTAVHRMTGDPPKRDLILPLWTADKKRVLNTIRRIALSKDSLTDAVRTCEYL